jgi:PAS domain S-box-containing protein
MSSTIPPAETIPTPHDSPADLGGAESRSQRRFSVSQAAHLYASGAEGQSWSARIQDISRGGMQLIVDRPVAGGPAVRIHWNDREITGIIRYQREDGADYRIGVELSSSWESLVNEVLAWQSEELRASNRDLELQATILKDQADLLDLTYDTILVTNMRGEITFWNSGAERMYGWTKAETAGRSLHELLDTTFSESPEQEAFQKLVADGRWEGELEQRRKDGSRIAIASRWALRRDNHGQPIGIMAINSDITRKKQAEQELVAYAAMLVSKNTELRQALDVACEASTVKTRFLAGVSHEFRTPLNGILGFSELLQDEAVGPLTAAQKECVADLLGCSRHLLTLVNQILDVTAIEAGKITFRYEDVRLENLVPEAIASLRGMALAKRIKIALDLNPRMGIVRADPVRVKQVLYNFISNAIKFSPEESGIRIRVGPENNDSYRLEVEDHGIGIALEDMSRLFAEFSQLGSTAKAKAGTGLGLAITKRIVEAQGGRVGVESTLGQGSRFYAILPCRPDGSAHP